MIALFFGVLQVVNGPALPNCAQVVGRAGAYTQLAVPSSARGCVPTTVYLPPGWTADESRSYPLIIFLHGQGGDETTFPAHVPVADLNQWITNGAVPPFVLVAPQGDVDRQQVQWYTGGNVGWLTADGPGSLRAFARHHLGVDGSPALTSVHGQSRGATGALFFGLQHSERFASAVANSFVSDYTLARFERLIARRRAAVLTAGTGIRVSIGAADLASRDRVASPRIHALLDEAGIPHEYEVLEGVGHTFADMWRFRHADQTQAGLRDFQFHATRWRARN